jgi:hypothetical protein
MKVVVLTFDDGMSSHLEFARPLLKQYGFGATFFINGMFIDDPARKGFMEWDQLEILQNDGFELGNHFNWHLLASEVSDEKVVDHIEWIERKFEELGITKPSSLSYPGFNRNVNTMEIVRRMGYRCARGGCEKVTPYHEYQEGAFGGGYDPAWDNQFNIPCSLFGKKFGHKEFVESLSKINEKEIGVYCIHGFTGDGHIGGALDEFSNISKEDFELCLDHLYVNDYKVIALRDVVNYCDFHIGMEHAKKYKEDFIQEHGDKYHVEFKKRMKGEG